MCGIAGVIHYNNIDLQKMLQALYHRGPDDQAIYLEDQVALLHTRLAIQDIKLGKQPFHFENYVIILNGEVYNHQALRHRLTEFSFQTNSDTETLLYLFIKYRYKMFTLIDGMFAFCIYDKYKQQIILARDYAGKKPLYYYKSDKRFIFASELNAIKAVQSLTIMPEAIENYLRMGMICQPFTVYSQVYKLEAASYLELNIDTLEFNIINYFKLLDYYQLPISPLSFHENLDLLENKLRKSINDRIMASDVDVGVFLSSGIDSNLIAAIAAQTIPNIKTFTVRSPGFNDESSLAQLAAKKYNTQHIELIFTHSINNDIEKILLSYGEPFMDSSAIPSYYLCREAANHVKVALSGDGADELFAGYRRYVPAAHSFMQYFKILFPLLKIFPSPHKKKSIYSYFYRLIALSHKQGLDAYLSATTDIFEDVVIFKYNKIMTRLADFIEKIAALPLSSLKKMLYLDFNLILFCDLLVKMDIASMTNSLEVRNPFLAKSMLEFAPSLSDSYKINQFKTKFILRKLAEKFLPRQLINQPKRGFEVPLKKWIDHDLHDRIHDALRPGCYAENFIDRSFIQRILHKKVSTSDEKRAKMLWSLYCLQVWYVNESKSFRN